MVGIIIGIVSLVVILLGLVVIIIVKKRRCKIDVKDVEELKMADIIAFFKNPELLEILKSSPDYFAVATKDNNGDKYIVTTCIFNKKENTVVEIDRACQWNAEKLSADLEESFGDKDMIFLS